MKVGLINYRCIWKSVTSEPTKYMRSVAQLMISLTDYFTVGVPYFFVFKGLCFPWGLGLRNFTEALFAL